MNWKNLIRIAKRDYGLISIQWDYDKDFKWAATCNCKTGTIRINYKLKGDEKQKIRVLFHELGHIHCHRFGIWKVYHNMKSRLTRKEKNTKIKTGLKAERWVDNWAEKEALKYFPDFKYEKGYSDKDNAQFYRKNYLSLFR